LFAFKEGNQILNQVQPQEYIEYFEDLNLSLTQKSGKKCRFATNNNPNLKTANCGKFKPTDFIPFIEFFNVIGVIC